MKKRFVLSVAALSLFLLIPLSSCKNESVAKIEPVADKVEQSELIKTLTQFNESIIPKSRAAAGDRTGWKIALADAKGALKGGRKGFVYGSAFSPSGSIAGAAVGAILAGAAWSIGAAWLESPMIRPGLPYSLQPRFDNVTRFANTEKMSDPVSFFKIVKKVSEGPVRMASDVGLKFMWASVQEKREVLLSASLHNMVLMSIEQDFPTNISTLDLDSIELEPETMELITSPEYVEYWEEVIAQATGSVATRAGGDDYYMEDYSETGQQVIRLFGDAYMQYPTSNDEMNYLINTYCNEIQSSEELDGEEKMQIRHGLVLAALSPQYWSTFVDFN